jgi:hypothetical protein
LEPGRWSLHAHAFAIAKEAFPCGCGWLFLRCVLACASFFFPPLLLLSCTKKLIGDLACDPHRTPPFHLTFLLPSLVRPYENGWAPSRAEMEQAEKNACLETALRSLVDLPIARCGATKRPAAPSHRGDFAGTADEPTECPISMPEPLVKSWTVLMRRRPLRSAQRADREAMRSQG